MSGYAWARIDHLPTEGGDHVDAARAAGSMGRLPWSDGAGRREAHYWITGVGVARFIYVPSPT